MHFIWVVLILLLAGKGMAFCPFSENLAASLSEKSLIALYQNCAEGLNDDKTQAKLAEMYDKGTSKTPRNLKKALKYYQLSAENGNAYSQARLAQLYMELDKSREGRAILYEFMNSVVQVSSFLGENPVQEEELFGGELIHPYVLLMLSNEKPENKWYYFSEELKAPPFAKSLLNGYKLDDEKKKKFTKEASRWKKRKLLEVARNLLSSAEYQQFSQTLYPLKGNADTVQRDRVLKDFKVKVEQKKKQDAEGAKAFY